MNDQERAALKATMDACAMALRLWPVDYVNGMPRLTELDRKAIDELRAAYNAGFDAYYAKRSA